MAARTLAPVNTVCSPNVSLGPRIPRVTTSPAGVEDCTAKWPSTMMCMPDDGDPAWNTTSLRSEAAVAGPVEQPAAVVRVQLLEQQWNGGRVAGCHEGQRLGTATDVTGEVCWRATSRHRPIRMMGNVNGETDISETGEASARTSQR